MCCPRVVQKLGFRVRKKQWEALILFLINEIDPCRSRYGTPGNAKDKIEAEVGFALALPLDHSHSRTVRDNDSVQVHVGPCVRLRTVAAFRGPALSDALQQILQHDRRTCCLVLWHPPLVVGLTFTQLQAQWST